MIRAVFDTVVLVRALLNERGRWARLVFDYADDYRLVVSSPVLRESLDVLRRLELARRFSTAPGRDPAAILDFLHAAEVVGIDESAIPRVCRDPKDDKVLATAKAGRVDYLVSEDEDLLVLTEYEGIRIVNAATFLAMLGESD